MPVPAFFYASYCMPLFRSTSVLPPPSDPSGNTARMRYTASVYFSMVSCRKCNRNKHRRLKGWEKPAEKNAKAKRIRKTKSVDPRTIQKQSNNFTSKPNTPRPHYDPFWPHFYDPLHKSQPHKVALQAPHIASTG